MYVIRNNGFFYTDEYYAATGAFRQVATETFATRAEAEQALRTMLRAWLREETLTNYLFDDRAAITAVGEYLKTEFPDEFGDVEPSGRWFFDRYPELMIPEAATDAQVDAIYARLGVELGRVFEAKAPEDDHGEAMEELYFGPFES
jgi:hypothetical protein